MNTPLRVSGPPSLISALPYLLGFQPTDSVICVLLQSDAISGCIRYELSNDTEQVFDLIESTLVNHNYDALVVVVVTENIASDLNRLLTKFNLAKIDLLDFLITDFQVYRSALCVDLSCCPPTGTDLTAAQRDTVSAELVLSGHVAATSRAELLERLMPRPINFNQEVADLLDGEKLLGSELLKRLTEIHRTAILETEMIEIVIALSDPEIRNDLEYTLFESIDGELTNPDQLRIAAENLRQCAVIAPRQLAAMPYGLLAFCFWNLGEWILADASVAQALKLDDMNSPARLTKRLIMQGVDPVTARRQIFPSAA
ncbi:MAG: DUF4192 family protein [Actinobacteria bacterium]|nr:DUF4192 family protein [Actinomycetota bacterium]